MEVHPETLQVIKHYMRDFPCPFLFSSWSLLGGSLGLDLCFDWKACGLVYDRRLVCGVGFFGGLYVYGLLSLYWLLLD